MAIISFQYDKILSQLGTLQETRSLYLKNHGRDSRNTFFRAPHELTHRVVAVPAFNIIEYYPNEELCIKLEVFTPFPGGVPPYLLTLYSVYLGMQDTLTS